MHAPPILKAPTVRLQRFSQECHFASVNRRAVSKRLKKKNMLTNAQEPEETSGIAPVLQGHREELRPSLPHLSFCLANGHIGSLQGYTDGSGTPTAASKSDPVGSLLSEREPAIVKNKQKTEIIAAICITPVFNVKVVMYFYYGPVTKWLNSHIVPVAL